MSRGKRFDNEPKLNIKKVLAVVIAIAVIVMFCIAIKKILNTDIKTNAESVNVKYFSAFANNKWGIINNSGAEVIKFEYDEIVVVPNNEKGVFVCTYDVDYAAGTYKTKALNENGDELFINYTNKQVLVNQNEGNYWYENILKVQNDGKYGLITLEGNEILVCEYDDISVYDGIEGLYIFKKDNKYGLVSSIGDIILNDYESINALKEYYKNQFGEIKTNRDEYKYSEKVGDYKISNTNIVYYTK